MSGNPFDKWLEERIPGWADDKKMETYFRAFKANRAVSPGDWDARHRFWTSLLREICLNSSSSSSKDQKTMATTTTTTTTHHASLAMAVLDRGTLKSLMSRKRRSSESSGRIDVPLGFDLIVAELERQGILLSESEFFQRHPLYNQTPFRLASDNDGGADDASASGESSSLFSGLGGWMWHNMVARPSVWVWTSVTGGGSSSASTSFHTSASKSDDADSGKKYIYAEVFKVAADKLCDYVFSQMVHPNVDRMWDVSKINAFFESHTTTSTIATPNHDVPSIVDPYFLSFLNSTNRALVVVLADGGRALLFPSSRTCLNNNNARISCTQQDVSIFTLKRTIEIVEKHKQSIQDRIEACLDEARACIRKKQRQMAQTHLKRKKVMMGLLEKRQITLENLNRVLDSIKEVDSDIMVLKALKTGTKSLQHLTKQMEDADVEGTMDHIASVLQDFEDVQSAMNVDITGISDEDVLEDLEELELGEEPPPASSASPIKPLKAAASPVASPVKRTESPTRADSPTSPIVSQMGRMRIADKRNETREPVVL